MIFFTVFFISKKDKSYKMYLLTEISCIQVIIEITCLSKSFDWLWLGQKNTNFIFMFIMQKLRFQFVQFKNKNRDGQLTLLNDVKNFDKTLKI